MGFAHFAADSGGLIRRRTGETMLAVAKVARQGTRSTW